MLLSDDAFRTVIESAPLVSIDLVVSNDCGEILLGERLNRPAQGTWFVPGGRVRKDERLDTAFERLTLNELGRSSRREQARLLGVFEHFYDDNVFSNAPNSAGTHYVVLAYALSWGSQNWPHSWPRDQHARFRWWPLQVAARSEVVHMNSKAYFSFLS
ncbi:GDP-mannose mannosyl hydrolase [Comamonas testosteroni]|uniref:GDP-mannose mannosyl hydrolase n=1 Tax=Comamonas testosteroni TaxID=285 RepID=A0A096FKZ7_COMTE|nr:GDP-mannose mannosyl hydrolase [Comamonas testosteroni]